jgi:hypothetical protein
MASKRVAAAAIPCVLTTAAAVAADEVSSIIFILEIIN